MQTVFPRSVLGTVESWGAEGFPGLKVAYRLFYKRRIKVNELVVGESEQPFCAPGLDFRGYASASSCSPRTYGLWQISSIYTASYSLQSPDSKSTLTVRVDSSSLLIAAWHTLGHSFMYTYQSAHTLQIQPCCCYSPGQSSEGFFYSSRSLVMSITGQRCSECAVC